MPRGIDEALFPRFFSQAGREIVPVVTTAGACEYSVWSFQNTSSSSRIPRSPSSTTSWSRPLFHSGYAGLQSMRIASSPSGDKGKTNCLCRLRVGNSSHATVPRSFSRMRFLNRFVWSLSSIRKYSPLTGTVGRPCCSADSLMRRCCSMRAHRRHA